MRLLITSLILILYGHITHKGTFTDEVNVSE